MPKLKPFHLLVNDSLQQVTVIGDGKETSGFNLMPLLAKLDHIPDTLVGIRRLLAQVDTKLDTTSDEHIAKFLYHDLYVLSKWIYLTQTYRVIFNAHVRDARGDCGGEFYGHPFDDGLPSPCLRDHQVTAVYGYDDKWLRKPLGNLIDDVNGDDFAKLTQRDRFNDILFDVMQDIENGNDKVAFGEALALAKCGAVIRSVSWSDMHRITRTSEGLQHQFFDSIEEEWNESSGELTVADLQAVWHVTL